MKTRLGKQTNRAEKMAAYHCCVPLCNNDSRYDRDKELSFFKFPTDKKEMKEWIVRIRRDIGKHFQVSVLGMGDNTLKRSLSLVVRTCVLSTLLKHNC